MTPEEVKDSANENPLPSRLLEKILLEAFLYHSPDTGICCAVTVEHGRIRLIGVAFPENVAFLVEDGRGEPGARAVEDYLLLGLNFEDEIGLGSICDAFPGACGRKL